MDSLPINATDLIVIIVLFISAALAFLRGFVHELLSIAAWVGAALVTLYLFPFAQPLGRDIISIPLLADIVVGVIIFLITLIGLSIVTRMVAGTVRASSLSALDRSLGLVFGVLRAGVILSLAWLLVVWAMPQPQERPDWIQEARSRPLLETGGRTLMSLVPGEIQQESEDRVREIQRDVQEDAFRSLTQPRTDEEAAPSGGYTEEERNDMDSLFENATGGSPN